MPTIEEAIKKCERSGFVPFLQDMYQAISLSGQEEVSIAARVFEEREMLTTAGIAAFYGNLSGEKRKEHKKLDKDNMRKSIIKELEKILYGDNIGQKRWETMDPAARSMIDSIVTLYFDSPNRNRTLLPEQRAFEFITVESGEKIMNMFKALDTNHNGYLDKMDFTSINQWYWHNIVKYFDLDGDDKITETEFFRFFVIEACMSKTDKGTNLNLLGQNLFFYKNQFHISLQAAIQEFGKIFPVESSETAFYDSSADNTAAPSNHEDTGDLIDKDSPSVGREVSEQSPKAESV